ncbi:MAG: PilZ domain-containing protein [Proteobacteria bacterium]|nr:PilZ domain-containing protein [Pseudomonadota bacterium]MBU1060010.1 PilZ domain-containing protein [Pseudomonadota bacterium]
MSRERREQERYPLLIQSKMTAETLSGQTPILEFVTANISTGGAFIVTDHPLPLVSKVRLEFLISLEELTTLKFVLSQESLRNWKGQRIWISASGIVIRHEPTGMAIMFDENYQIRPMNPITKNESSAKGHT